MRSLRVLILILLTSLVPYRAGFGQSKKPVIIRDTDVAEGVEEERKPKERNPAEAKNNIDIGNFYYKRKNYVGAILRYLTAIEYQPDSARAHKSLVKAYKSIVQAYMSIDRTRESLKEAEDRYGKISVATEAFKVFLRDNPDSAKTDDFNKMIGKLREVSSLFDNL